VDVHVKQALDNELRSWMCVIVTLTVGRCREHQEHEAHEDHLCWGRRRWRWWWWFLSWSRVVL